MARREDELGQPQEDVEDAEGSDSEEESEGLKERIAVKSKGKSRRKACEKPEGSDQKRQAFSKRKRGLILKSYQLYKLTDARVFVFIVNDKGSSWAYASPGFAKTLSNQHLSQMREYAQLAGNQRLSTEIMPHPHNDAEDRRLDDRPNVLRANMLGESAVAGAGTPSRMAAVAVAASQAAEQMAPPPPVALPPSRRGAAASVGPLSVLQPPLQLGAAPMELAGPRDVAAGQAHARGRPPGKFSNFKLEEEGSIGEEAPLELSAPGHLAGGEPIITPSGRRMAAAVGIALGSELPLEPVREEERDPPPGGLRSGGGGGGVDVAFGPGTSSDRAASTAAGRPPPLKQARYRDPTLLSGDPTAPSEPPPPPPARGRRGDPPPPPPPRRTTALDDLHAAANEQHPFLNGTLQQAAFSSQQHMLAGAQLQAAAAAAEASLAAAAAAEEDLRLALPPPALRNGRGGLVGSQLLLSNPPVPPSRLQPRNEKKFMRGQVVQGSDGQLYRIVGDLDEGLEDYGMQLPEEQPVYDAAGAPALMMSMLPAMQHHLPLQLQRQQQLLAAGVGAGGGNRGFGVAPGGRC
ncbi:hypothetical protein Agub_g4223 [Astrephomene gubernaculifera]|uniref:MADS-box domain-containing protein n=1 Tax=Astrephomene gubernaculifera TaxID=47775 RepID=A0AAD3HJP2_9CHLO|nr:hypothetical protein Agub_g4223 [Astrephomene gubernaculifera]